MLPVIASITLCSCMSKQEKMENRMKDFITTYEAKAIPLYKNMALTSWNANISGTNEDYCKKRKGFI